MLVPITAPSEEPISVAEARTHCKVDADVTVEDGLFAIWIASARRYAEAYCRRSFVTQGWRLVLDGFGDCIELERGQVQQITALAYRDMAGATQTVTWAAAANSLQRSTDGSLVADLSCVPARISAAFGRTWPIAMPEAGAVRVEFTAGYGAAAAVPEGIKSWMLLRVATLYENRGENASGIVTPLPHVDRMLDEFIVHG